MCYVISHIFIHYQYTLSAYIVIYVCYISVYISTLAAWRSPARSAAPGGKPWARSPPRAEKLQSGTRSLSAHLFEPSLFDLSSPCAALTHGSPLCCLVCSVYAVLAKAQTFSSRFACSRSLCCLAVEYSWRDAVRGARWVLEYLDLLRDIWASELTSQIFVTRETVKTCSG